MKKEKKTTKKNRLTHYNCHSTIYSQIYSPELGKRAGPKTRFFCACAHGVDTGPFRSARGNMEGGVVWGQKY